MSVARSGLLATWGTAFLTGRAGYDDALHQIARNELHRVVGLPGHPAEVPLGWALTAWRDRATDALRLVLPVPGDPRGLPGPGEFSTAALTAGQGVLGGGLGLVPEATRHGSAAGSATYSVLWTAHPDVPDRPGAGPPQVSEAEYELTEALREATTALRRADATSWRPELAGDVAALRRPVELPLPPGHPPRAVRLLAQADRLAALLELAEADGTGPLTAAAAESRAAALRPLWTAVRQARLAAYNANLG